MVVRVPKDQNSNKGENMRYCPSCHSEVASNAGQCPKCGKRFTSAISVIIAVTVALAVFSVCFYIFTTNSFFIFFRH